MSRSAVDYDYAVGLVDDNRQSFNFQHHPCDDRNSEKIFSNDTARRSTGVNTCDVIHNRRKKSARRIDKQIKQQTHHLSSEKCTRHRQEFIYLISSLSRCSANIKLLRTIIDRVESHRRDSKTSLRPGVMTHRSLVTPPYSPE